MSASSIDVLYQVTPNVQPKTKLQGPARFMNLTSLNPSKVCGPLHSSTNEGHRLVRPPNEKTNEEVGTEFHVECVFVSAAWPSTPFGSPPLL